MWHSRPPPFMANTILNFHFDYLHPSLSNNIDCPAYPGHDAIKIVLQKSY